MTTTGVNSYRFWAWIVLIFLTLNGLITPNLISLSFVFLSMGTFFMWAFGWMIEEKAFKIVSGLSMTIAFFYVWL